MVASLWLFACALSIKQGSSTYHLKKVFGVTPLGFEPDLPDSERMLELLLLLMDA